jgi:DNA polymerase (family 10)
MWRVESTMTDARRMENYEIADVLEELADLLEIRGANRFRVRAYRDAARTVREHAVPMRQLVADGADLTELPTIGDDMSDHITELVETGELGQLEEVAEEVPRTLAEITRLPGVGPRRTKKLWDQLGVTTVDELEEAAEAGRVEELDGFGAKTQQKILTGIEQHRRHTERFLLSDADLYVEPVLEHLRDAPGVGRLEVAGSYRRRKETVGDVDVLVEADEGGPVMEHFTSYGKVAEVVQAGDTRGTVVLDSGVQVDLRIVDADSYGAALVYFTGSKEHNVALRKRALARDLTVSEYGVFELEEDGADADEEADDGTDPEAPGEGDDGGEGDRAADPEAPGETTTGRTRGVKVAGDTEEDVYAAVDLPWIPPELREARGEIEAAEQGELPELIEPGDVRGDLQMHTTWSDGKASVEAMLEACAARGYEYFAITDHSQALAMTGGLDEEKLRRQWEEMDEVVARHDEIRLLRSLEVDVLADGSLDLADDLLEELDLVVVSVHSKFDLDPDRQTERLVAALKHPQTDVLAHPTGRIIGRRDPYDFDLDRVLETAAQEGVALELNAHPDRLDLKDTHLMRAVELGAKVVISTDAHRPEHLALMRYGVEQARRAWLEPEDVLNTLPLDDFLVALRSGPRG